MDASKARPSAIPFAPTVVEGVPSQDTGPVLTIKTADKGKAIVIPPKVDANAYTNQNSSHR